MKVLMVSSNTLPAAPTGPVYVAGALRQVGHDVRIYEALFDDEQASELRAALEAFQPDVVGVSIRLVHGDSQDASAPFGTRYKDLRPRVKALVDAVRQHSRARIVLGGPGFNYYAADWLTYLDLPLGLCGEGEEAFPRLLDALAAGGDPAGIPGAAVRANGRTQISPANRVMDLNCQGLPAYDLLDWQRYAELKITPAVFTKRGCAFGCTFCPYASLEGKRYRLKSPQRVLDEIHHTLLQTGSRRVMICDNSFNAPRRHAEALCHAFRDDRLDFEWGSGDLKPLGVDRAMVRLMQESGCYYLNLSVESGSDAMLASMRRGYTARQVRQSIEALSGSSILFGASLMLGAPGETPGTISETLALMSDYEIPLGVWVTVGVYLWTGLQEMTRTLLADGSLPACADLFAGPVYLSPQLSREYLAELAVGLRSRPGYTVQVNRSDRLAQ